MQTLLANAPAALNLPNNPWYISVFANQILVDWKWMDATFFSPFEISDEDKGHFFIVTLNNNGTYKEQDRIQEKQKGIGFSDGKLQLGGSSESFRGKANRKSFEFGLGKDNRTGDVGFIGFKYDSTACKQPIRDYLAAYGWKKAGLFG